MSPLVFNEVHACMMCAFLCEVLRVTKMSVDRSNVEMLMMMMMMCMVNKDDDVEDFRILRWLTFAG